MLVDLINKYLTEDGKSIDKGIVYDVGLLSQWAFERQFMTDNESDTTGKLRMSAVGKCPRQIAYAYHGIEKNGKEIDSRAKLTFFAGDVVELVITQIAKLALKRYGVGALTAVGKEQITISKTIQTESGAVVITGHPDGLFLLDKAWYLLECKSMSSFSFERFQNGELDPGYIAQINAYMECLGVAKCVVVGYNKDSNVLHEMVVDKDPEVLKKIGKTLYAVVNSTPEKLPEPPEEYAPNAKGIYPWMCSFCGWWKICRTNAERIVVNKSYKLKEKGNERDKI